VTNIIARDARSLSAEVFVNGRALVALFDARVSSGHTTHKCAETSSIENAMPFQHDASAMQASDDVRVDEQCEVDE
jgi:hypothetical protein